MATNKNVVNLLQKVIRIFLHGEIDNRTNHTNNSNNLRVPLSYHSVEVRELTRTAINVLKGANMVHAWFAPVCQTQVKPLKFFKNTCRFFNTKNLKVIPIFHCFSCLMFMKLIKVRPISHKLYKGLSKSGNIICKCGK
jgi:hypothetical protein